MKFWFVYKICNFCFIFVPTINNILLLPSDFITNSVDGITNFWFLEYNETVSQSVIINAKIRKTVIKNKSAICSNAVFTAHILSFSPTYIFVQLKLSYIKFITVLKRLGTKGLRMKASRHFYAFLMPLMEESFYSNIYHISRSFYMNVNNI